MTPMPLYQVDAFTSRVFGGNPASVCPLVEWPDDALLQAITIEHNQSETAFFVPRGDRFELRWFTTSNGEIDLCGHATLASAHVIFTHLFYTGDTIRFETRQSGTLFVTRKDGWLTLDFPAWPPQPAEVPPGAIEGLGGVAPKECHLKRDYLLVYDDEDFVRGVQPDYAILGKIGPRICITAAGRDVDFVSRFFCPGDALQEDPVTGSAHSMLIPYWAARLGKTTLSARQVSPRGGDLRCELLGDRVHISGQAVTYMQGTIYLP
jgi:predicted PhzF superfamily epimerase YddE/YHI9